MSGGIPTFTNWLMQNLHQMIPSAPANQNQAPQQMQMAGSAPPASAPAAPIFNMEGPDFYDKAFARNSQFAHPGPYDTPLTPPEEGQFRQWVQQNKVPFDVQAKVNDYDMRGYWKDMLAGKAEQWKGQGSHFPDTYKTPYDTTFSAESKYAKPGTPFVWKGDNLIDKRDGSVVFAPSGKEQ